MLKIVTVLFCLGWAMAVISIIVASSLAAQGWGIEWTGFHETTRVPSTLEDRIRAFAADRAPPPAYTLETQTNWWPITIWKPPPKPVIPRRFLPHLLPGNEQALRERRAERAERRLKDELQRLEDKMECLARHDNRGLIDFC